MNLYKVSTERNNRREHEIEHSNDSLTAISDIERWTADLIKRKKTNRKKQTNKLVYGLIIINESKTEDVKKNVI